MNENVKELVRNWFDVRIADQLSDGFSNNSSVEISIMDINTLMRELGLEEFQPVKLYRISGNASFEWSVEVKATSIEAAEEFVSNNMPDFDVNYNNDADYEDADVDYHVNTEITDTEEL